MGFFQIRQLLRDSIALSLRVALLESAVQRALQCRQARSVQDRINEFGHIRP